jgi:OFA family oxalate/formate antiporter-like MFS transporter
MSNDGEKVMNRWLVVVGALLIQLCLGAIYAWSVFTPSLREAGWSRAQTQVVFSAGLASFAVVMFLVGWLLPKVSLRMRAVLGALALGAGYALAGLVNPTSFPVLFTLIGLLGGAGIGLAYVVPIAVGMQWFPDKKGLITGLSVAGFGFGAMGWVKLAGAWGHLIETAGLGRTFLVYGVIFAAVCLIGSIWMVKPPEGWKPPGWEPSLSEADGAAAVGSVDHTMGRMLTYPQAHMIVLCFVFASAAGLMTIGLMKLFPKEALAATGIEPAAASAISGTAMAVFFSLGNGIGRIAWGALSDRLRYRRSIFLMLVTQGVIVICFQWMAGTKSLLYLGALLIGFNFGGNFALFPIATADTFGKKCLTQNYGFIFLSYGIGGVFGPILGGKLGDSGNFPMAFTICGVLCLVAAGIILTVRPPRHATVRGETGD